MALTPGTRLGVYEVLAHIGEGGMGQVYRGTDTTLGRQVAIKILPDAFAADAERVARFEREAKTLASLNHPNIAAIYGFEKAGGTHALVMELVEGDDLSQRIARGAIPIDEALPIAKQIAEALEAAHEQGIIHRDLKPANIKVRPDGTVKVLDFGLAKAMEPPAGASVSNSMAPTITTPAMMTGVGMILGTAAYMSPEQAKGRPADKRSDVWAFGAVLYEMLTGVRAFTGDDMVDVLGAVARLDPDWTKLPATTPAPIRLLVEQCLAKDRKARLGDIAGALFVLRGFNTLSQTLISRPADPIQPTWRRSLPWAVAILALAGGGLAVWTTRPTGSPVVTRLVADMSKSPFSPSANFQDIAVTPDGRRIVYATSTGLFVRPLDSLDAVPLGGASGANNPFVSPDGTWVGFADDAGTSLQKVSIGGGAPTAIARGVTNLRGSSWGLDDTIVFATSDPATGLLRVSAAGGEPEVLTRPNGGADHLWPDVLPNGRGVLFTAREGGGASSRLAVLDLQTRAEKTLIQDAASARYVAPGYIVYGLADTLWAVAFDLSRLEVVGAPVPVVEGVVTKNNGAANFSVSADGSLVYVAGGASSLAERTLVWVDQQGREEPPTAPARRYSIPRVSPDGTRLAVTVIDDIWTYALGRGTFERLTLEANVADNPTWSPDGARVAYYSAEAGGGIYVRPANGTGNAERLTTGNHRPTSWTPDGTTLVFVDLNARDIWMLPLAGARTPTALVATETREDIAVVSPDGGWLAYETLETGQDDIFVRPFPDVGAGRWRISTDGGLDPVWARDGRTLFYRRGQAIMAVTVTGDSPLAWSRPRLLFEGDYAFSTGATFFDVGPDGRFLMMKEARSEQALTPPRMVVVLNWREELKRLVPAK